MNCVGAVWWVFCASSYEMLCFSITLIIGHLPPFDMYCVLIIPALRAFEPAISVPQNQPRRDSHHDFDFACVGSGNHSAIHLRFAPVMYEDSGPATNATNAATSSTCP